MDKKTHAEAGYHQGFGEHGHHCSICQFFILGRPVHCEKVVDPIRAGDGCNLFKLRTGAVTRDNSSGVSKAAPLSYRPLSNSSGASEGVEDAGEIDDLSGKKDTGPSEKNKHWGYHLLLDVSECNENINSNEAIGKFFDELVTALKMKKLAKPSFIDVSDVEGRGVTAWQPITTSHITIHTDDDKMSAYIDVFSCAPYEPQVAVDCVKKWFAPKDIGGKWITRDAGKWPEK